MKKIIGLFTILLITTSVFGQINIRDFSYIERTTSGTITFADRIGSDTDYDNIPYVNFIVRDTTKTYDGENVIAYLYILAYEPNYRCYENTMRNVYLYCRVILDKTNDDVRSDITNNWVRVSDVVMTNYFKDSNNYRDIDFFKFDNKRHNSSSSHVDFDGNVVIFTVNIHTMKDGRMTITTERFELTCNKRTFDGNFYITTNRTLK